MGIKKSSTTEKVRLALITGASSGIGAATARTLSQKGFHVFLTARRQERLLALRSEIEADGGKVDIFTADLTCEEERRLLFNKVHELDEPIDLLVNNAGSGWYGYYTEMPWETAREMMSLNISACVHLTSLFLPGMRVRGYGHIINIGSIAGSFPNQGVAIYSATKSFLDAFTSVLFREFNGTRIHISIVRAGPVVTEFCESASSRTGGRHLPTEYIGVSAEKVARCIWDLFKRPRKVVYVPGYLRITPWLEFNFGWLVDRLGPLLLKYRTR